MTKFTRRHRPTLIDIARGTGVSIATVSNVLNGKGSAGEDVRRAVQQAAKEMGYRVNHAAKATRTGQTHSIGLILPDLGNPFFPQVAQAVQATARAAGYAVILVDSQNDVEVERAGAEDLVRRGVEGIVWCPASEHDTLQAFRSELPIVVVDRPLPNYDTVSSDYAAGGRLLAQQVVAAGHERIGLIVGPQALSSARLRREGFIEGLGKKARVEWEVENPFSIILTPETRRKLAESEATAIACGNDYIAIGVLRALYELDKRVPGEVSVVGFDDIPWAEYTVPGLTTVAQPIGKLGAEASKLLIKRIGGDGGGATSIRLDMHFAARDTLLNRRD